MNAHSTKFRLTVLIVGSLALLALGIGLFATVNVSGALAGMMRESSRNAVMLSANNVRSHYQEFFSLKVESAMLVKRELSRLESLIRALAAEGDDFLRILDRVGLPPGMSVWMLDDSLDPVFVKGDMTREHAPYGRNDIKGREVGRNMLRLSKMGVTANALIQFPPLAGVGGKHFGHHFYLESRKLLVGLWTDLAPHEEAQERKLDDIIQTMRTHLQRIRLDASGFVFIVDASGAPVIPPGSFALPDMTGSVNPATGNMFLDDVRAAAGSPDAPAPVVLRERREGKGRPAQMYAEFVKPLKWYVAGVSFVDEINAPGRKLSLYLAFGMLAATGLICLVALLLVGKLTGPLVQLTLFARRLPGADFFREPEEHGVLQRLSAASRRDEVGELSRALLFMDGALRQRIRELVDAAGARERMEGELQAATGIQMGFLPNALDEHVVMGRFGLAGNLVPAREVGGDLYDFFMLDADRLCLVIGDVSGKGVPAALFMSMTMVLVRAAAADADGPDAIMRSVNDNLVRENPSDMFVTLFIAFLDLRTGELTFANGGHNPPLLRSRGQARPLEDLSGPMAGVFEDIDYRPYSIVMSRGDQLFMYTDGVTEAMNDKGEMFGENALLSIIGKNHAPDPGAMIQTVQQAVTDHAAGAPASDDLTMLFLTYQGNRADLE